MRGGGRSKSHQGSPGAKSVRALNADRTAIYNAPDTIINVLEGMTPDERTQTYILINERNQRIRDNGEIEHNEFNPLFRTLFNKIFHKRYNEEAQTAREIMVKHMIPADLDLDGGKTRRNRRRRRNRRSLKRKHSRRR
jgi:hypothetical protein